MHARAWMCSSAAAADDHGLLHIAVAAAAIHCHRSSLYILQSSSMCSSHHWSGQCAVYTSQSCLFLHPSLLQNCWTQMLLCEDWKRITTKHERKTWQVLNQVCSLLLICILVFATILIAIWSSSFRQWIYSFINIQVRYFAVWDWNLATWSMCLSCGFFGFFAGSWSLLWKSWIPQIWKLLGEWQKWKRRELSIYLSIHHKLFIYSWILYCCNNLSLSLFSLIKIITMDWDIIASSEMQIINPESIVGNLLLNSAIFCAIICVCSFSTSTD